MCERSHTGEQRSMFLEPELDVPHSSNTPPPSQGPPGLKKCLLKMIPWNGVSEMLTRKITTGKVGNFATYKCDHHKLCHPIWQQNQSILGVLQIGFNSYLFNNQLQRCLEFMRLSHPEEYPKTLIFKLQWDSAWKNKFKTFVFAISKIRERKKLW